MSVSSTPAAATGGAIHLGDEFARLFPELALPWQAAAVPDPHLLVLNAPLAAELGLDPAWLAGPDGLGLVTGTVVPEGATPVAQGYAGHQFGGYVPRLGDGRALLMGELTDRAGRRRDLHLKGSGPTPFARGGDGLAAIGPMLREYVISEAMHALGVRSTRALAVTATGATVLRETPLPGAVLARVADSHLRVGSFQYAAQRDARQPESALVRRLADFAIARHHRQAADAPAPYLALFDAVVAAQASLVAQWMLVGFVHGVMNTDNMTIAGETIDYGPCAFLEAYDRDTVFSSIDAGGRYRYGNQPAVAQWNLARFAETLLALFDDDGDAAVQVAMEHLNAFGPRFDAAWLAGMRTKLGVDDDLPDQQTKELAEDVLDLLQRHQVDYTGFFRALGAAARGDDTAVRALFDDAAGFDQWARRWRALNPDAAAMDRVNPIYIPRNHLVEQALSAGVEGDLGPVQRLLEAVTDPYRARDGLQRYAEAAPPEFGPYRTFCGT
ncbi:protein adenylyltransferase SelO [Mycolicibacillus parakoreensis]|uniref:protein adenylyltransferase SelO n=1 Tax=Mycolicibacillus parakoreensis TaxID=1069221 RepID=UPI003898D77E